ncbi:MAG TPA: LD-carboxypeptidase, partial [Caulobacteraceae bacterium]|nr:LD-carboxypeptidase [Caulobacteraceae bacterium]
RIVEPVMAGLEPAARDKQYLGYSDAGAMLGALYGRGFERLAHGPMANDIRRTNGEAAATRALAWLVDADVASLEPSAASSKAPTAAFNLMMLSSIVGTPWQPDLAGHILYLEEVSEYMYRIDRALFHVMSNERLRRIAGLRLGRCSDVPENDPDFAQTEEEIARYWCDRAGVPYLGRADIGHDAGNRIVPFGRPA